MVPTSRAAWIDTWEDGLAPSAAAKRSAARIDARFRATRYYGTEATARATQRVLEVESVKALPQLKVVTSRRPRWGMAILTLAFVALLLGVSIVVPTLVGSAATSVESAVGQLEAKQKDLATAASALAAQIAALSSPERVAEQAAQLGLEKAQSVHYVDTAVGPAATEGDPTVAGR